MTVRKTKDTMTRSLKKVESQLEAIAEEAFDYLVSITPKDRGNARRKTRLRDQTIEMRYPYAERLDNGYSDQAPNGMSTPTLKYLQKNKKKLVRK